MDIPTYSDDPAAWGVVRELMDNQLDLNGEAYEELVDARYLLRTGKYSDAEPLFTSGIEKLNRVRELLSQEGESLVVGLCGKDVDPQKVLRFARWELDGDIEYAEEGYRQVRTARNRGIDQIPPEERYREILRLKKRLTYDFLLWSIIWTAGAVGVGIWAYSVTPWLLIITIGTYLVLVAVFYLRFAFAVEHLIFGDGEMQEFARRDGW
ncbi:hypothetical protein MYX82_14560 [Acidobacteria bacterium AH-259-D05]|nr:hypothetical protein [Acidobacteria bacterium AH-259-D05]